MLYFSKLKILSVIVITSGGIVGTIERVVDNDKVEVVISDNVKVEIIKSTGIQALVSNTEPKK